MRFLSIYTLKHILLMIFLWVKIEHFRIEYDCIWLRIIASCEFFLFLFFCSIKKLGEQDHFHYSSVELGPVVVSLVHLDITETGAEMRLQVESNARKW